MSEDDQIECPLCLEELDITDKNFIPCQCGYQVCLWCWHQIKREYNNKCPACRNTYSEEPKQKSNNGNVNREEIVRKTKQQKRQQKERIKDNSRKVDSNRNYNNNNDSILSSNSPFTSNNTNGERNSSKFVGPPIHINKRALTNVRVLQRNLVYAIGLPLSFANEDKLRRYECFGQYGKIIKVVVNKSHISQENNRNNNSTASAYVTYAKKEDAQTCIYAIDGYYLEGKQLRASFGTTKYCNFFLRNMTCNNPECLYLHELGDDADSFTKEEMQAGRNGHGKGNFREAIPGLGFSSILNPNGEIREGDTFPLPGSGIPSNVMLPSQMAKSDEEKEKDQQQWTITSKIKQTKTSNIQQRQAQSAAAIDKLRKLSYERKPSYDEHNTQQTQIRYKPKTPIPQLQDSPLVNVSREPPTNWSERVASSITSPRPSPLPSTFKINNNYNESDKKKDITDSSSPSSVEQLKLNERPENINDIEQNNKQINKDDVKLVTINKNDTINGITIDKSLNKTNNEGRNIESPFASLDAVFESLNISIDNAMIAPLDSFSSAISSLPTPSCNKNHSRFAFANNCLSPSEESKCDISSSFSKISTSFPSFLGNNNDNTNKNNSENYGLLNHHTDTNITSINDTIVDGNELSGLAFLQQMLPNVNISFGGDYQTRTSEFSEYSSFTNFNKENQHKTWNQSQQLSSTIPSYQLWGESSSSTPFNFTQRSPSVKVPHHLSVTSAHDPAILSQGTPYSSFTNIFINNNNNTSVSLSENRNDNNNSSNHIKNHISRLSSPVGSSSHRKFN